MAEGPIVMFILNKLEYLFFCGVQLLSGIHEEAQFITNEMDPMRTFIIDIYTREHKDPNLQLFVKQVKEASFKADDILDDFTFHFTNDGRGRSRNLLSKVSSSVNKLKARYRIISELRQIKPTISSLSEKCKTIATPVVDQASSSNTFDIRDDALLLEEHELEGIDKPREQLIEWLLEGDSKLKVIPVLGMGGLGKTALVKKVYDNSKVSSHFQYHVWITVSHPLKVNKLLMDIIEQLHADMKQTVPKEVRNMRNHRLKEVLKGFLQQSSYLFVLDDVWSIEAWNAVKPALTKRSGGRVILTSRVSDAVPTSSHELDIQTYQLKHLSREDSWDLFCKKTFEDKFCPDHLVETSLSILGKCDGLPLAIVTISGLLKTKDASQSETWEMINKSLETEFGVNYELGIMNTILSLSYNELPHNIKSCFLYFSLFPAHHIIECRRLIRLWIAEGFVEPIQGRTKEEVADGYLKMLFNRNLIQSVETTSDGRPKTCRVHDILHKISILKSIDQSFAAILREQDERWPDLALRISIHNTLSKIRQRKSNSQHRSLFLFGVTDLLTRSSITTLFQGKFRMLKVLDLQSAPLEEFPDVATKLLHLRYLSLRDTKVKTIPRSIGKLQMLETLDLKHAFVTELPGEVLKLPRLRHLLVYRYEKSYANFNYKYGFKAPDKIGDLCALQKLCFIEADQGGPKLITELGRLHQLRRLGILQLKKEDGEALCSSIEKLTQLRALSVTSVGEEEIIDLDHIPSPPRCLQGLQRLYLTGKLVTLPTWIPWVHSLVRLTLKGSRLKDDPLVHLRDLPALVHLELLQVYEGKTLSFLKHGLKKLKFLGLAKFEELETITIQEGAMPCLEKLIIQHCNSLKELPSGIEHLTTLKVLEFFDMPDDMIRTLRENTLKVGQIPQVYSTNLIDKAWKVTSLGTQNEREDFLDPDSVSGKMVPLYNWK